MGTTSRPEDKQQPKPKPKKVEASVRATNPHKADFTNVVIGGNQETGYTLSLDGAPAIRVKRMTMYFEKTLTPFVIYEV